MLLPGTPDEDAIAANQQRVEELTHQFAHILDRYLSRKIGHVRCATTAGDTGILDVEDLAAVPDLIGGALTDLFSALDARGARVSEKFTPPQPEGLPAKATQILSWLASRRTSTLIYVVEPGTAPGVIEVTDALLSPHTILHMPRAWAPNLG